MASPVLPSSKQLTPEELEDLARKTHQSVSLDHEYVFVDPFPEEVQCDCSICLEILQKPQIISCCGHRFCLKCTESLRSTQCPLCKAWGIEFFPDKKLERQISQRIVYCSLRNDGCDWTGELCKLNDHLDIDRHKDDEMACQYFPVPCDYCTEYVRRRDVDAHKKHCLHRPSRCEYCRSRVRYDQLKTHYETCQVCPAVCPNVQCSKPMKAWELDSHLDKCPWSPLTCEYQHAGCDKIILRKDMESHIRRNALRHLDLVKEKLSELEEEVKSRGEVSFLVISDLPEDALSEHKLKSRFGQYGLVDRVQLLDPALRAAIVEFSFPSTYQIVIEESRRGNIKFCREYVQANPVYSTMTDKDLPEVHDNGYIPGINLGLLSLPPPNHN